MNLNPPLPFESDDDKGDDVDDSVIGHGIGGKVSQLKWRDSLKASPWSKRRWSVLVTRSCSQSK